LQCRLKGPLVNNKKELPGPDLAAFLKENLFQVSSHPGPDLHSLAGLGPGHVFSVNRDGLRGHRRYYHRHRGRGLGSSGWFLGAARDYQEEKAESNWDKLPDNLMTGVFVSEHGITFYGDNQPKEFQFPHLFMHGNC